MSIVVESEMHVLKLLIVHDSDALIIFDPGLYLFIDWSPDHEMRPSWLEKYWQHIGILWIFK